MIKSISDISIRSRCDGVIVHCEPGEDRRAIIRNNSEKILIKIIEFYKNNLFQRTIDNINDEIEIVRKLIHPGIFVPSGPCIIEPDKYIIIPYEYHQGEKVLENLLKFGSFSEDRVQIMLQDIIKACLYCESVDFVIENLNIDSLYITQHGTVKIVNIGKLGDYLRKYYTWGNYPNISLINNFVTPEQISGNSVNHKSVVWLCGVITYILLSNQYPFGEQDVYENIIQERYNFPDRYFSHISEECLCFIEKILISNSDMRPTMKEIMTHFWFRGG